LTFLHSSRRKYSAAVLPAPFLPYILAYIRHATTEFLYRHAVLLMLIRSTAMLHFLAATVSPRSPTRSARR
jgi:hypothetical protein